MRVNATSKEHRWAAHRGSRKHVLMAKQGCWRFLRQENS